MAEPYLTLVAYGSNVPDSLIVLAKVFIAMKTSESSSKYILNIEHRFLTDNAIKIARLGFWSYDLLSGIASWCSHMYELLGRETGDYPTEEGGWFSLVHPLDQERVRKHMEDALTDNNALYDIDFRMRHAAGYWIKIHSKARVVDLDSDGNPQRILGMVTYLGDAQSILDGDVNIEYVIRRVTDYLPEVFWIADPDIGSIDYVNPAYETVWGRSIAELYENPRSFMDSIHPADIDNLMAVLSRQQKGLPFDHEYRIICPDGSIRWIWDRGFPVLNEDGQVMQYVGLAQDMTRFKQSEQRLREQIKHLETAIEKLKGGCIEQERPGAMG